MRLPDLGRDVAARWTYPARVGGRHVEELPTVPAGLVFKFAADAVLGLGED